ncbi:hypothetical protein EPN90_02450 [Patescibacteria group bacterium]|nr:MAG: hypothetical protein EPN90_02450 [Patescibacteria group bacterium]
MSVLGRELAVTGFQKLQESLGNVGEKAFGTKTPTPLPIVVGQLIKTFIALLAVIFLGLTIYGGYLWLTARGNEQMVEKAKETIKAGVIGLIIILSAYAIATYVVGALVGAAFKV